MYLQEIKTLLTDAMRQTFDGDYVVAQFRGITISVEFPVEKQNYPGIWVDFEPVGDLEIAGIGHTEFSVAVGGASAQPFTRWRFQGMGTYTIAALASRERDMLFDEVVRVFAFGSEHPSTTIFRQVIEDNPWIAVNMDFGTISQRGFAASPGTPWGGEEIIYEATVAMNLIGECVSDNITGALVPISAIAVTDLATGQVDPDPSW